MKQLTNALLCFAVAGLLTAGCARKEEPAADTATTDTTATEPAVPSGESVQVTLTAANDSDFTGTATFTQDGTAVRVVVDLAGVDGAGNHGFHIHEHGTCEAHDAFKSAGGHWNPAGVEHACPPTEPRHAGDLGNIEVGSDGAAHMETIVEGLTISTGDYAVAGRALMLHAKPDDCKTQPTGDAGDRVACGVIPGGPPHTADHTAHAGTTGQ